ncbi:MAG: PilZ domain-containing protein [Candidatus Gygaella obscura]|nr:PilZ domain-containing protein [Candidatus Gygaella obscura]
MDKNIIERRKFVRLDLDAKVDFQIKEVEGEQVLSEKTQGRVKNISVEGVCFSAKTQLKPESKIELEVILPENKDKVKLKGEVAWSTPLESNGSEKGLFDIGIKIHNIEKSDENKFLVYVCDKMTKQLNKYLHL